VFLYFYNNGYQKIIDYFFVELGLSCFEYGRYSKQKLGEDVR